MKELIRIRWIHSGIESDEEDRILEKMDVAWWDLTEEDRKYLQGLPTRSLLRSKTDRIIRDTGRVPGPRRITVDMKEAA